MSPLSLGWLIEENINRSLACQHLLKLKKNIPNLHSFLIVLHVCLLGMKKNLTLDERHSEQNCNLHNGTLDMFFLMLQLDDAGC